MNASDAEHDHPLSNSGAVLRAYTAKYHEWCNKGSSTKPSACLQDAEAEGCITVSGLEMFVGQAAQQFELFTGQKAPIDLMRQATLDSMAGH